jgi:LPS-assembly protein
MPLFDRPRPSRRRMLLAGVFAGACTLLAFPTEAPAQFAVLKGGSKTTPPPSRNEPVTFTADNLEYDRDRALVTATGNVEAWQGDHILKADRVTFDRNTNVAAAEGHVVLVEPDGQVLFSDYAELTEGMRDGVLRGMRSLLAENGRLAANGARRTEGKLNELSRVVYSTCNLCEKDPSKPPLWQLRAYSALQDTENKRIEYQDAVMDFAGVPVFWFPYFSHADPSVKRASGFLIPSVGSSSQLGPFVTVPYYWVLDDQSDVTLAPTVASKAGPNLAFDYRRNFNSGVVRVEGGLGYDENKPQADIFARGRFSYDATWRYGFDFNRASSSNYLRDFRVANRGDVLTSQAYVEGFGVGAYTRLDVRAYQSLLTTIQQSRLPYVLPRYQYDYFGGVDPLGGRLTFDTQNFNVLREEGTNTQRLGFSTNWRRPFQGEFGESYALTVRTDAAGYVAHSLDQNPNYGPTGSFQTARAQPNVALDSRLPLWRDAGSWGSQVIEPRVMVVAGPNTGGSRNQKIPNEDSLDLDFTDANLFEINRFPGIDRQEGGLRLNAALKGTWNLPNGALLEGLVGQSYRSRKDDTFAVGSGLENKVSDVVARATVQPTPWLDFTGRARFDHQTWNVRFADALAGVGNSLLRVTGGYIYSAVNPYYQYDQATIPASYYVHRNEGTIGISTGFDHYRLSASARRDLNLNKMVSAGVHATYDDECFTFDANFTRRYTSVGNDTGDTIFLFQLTFKTVGQFGFHAF